MDRPRFLNLLLLSFVNFLWAAQYPAYKFASKYMDAVNLNFWALVFSIALLAPFLILESRRRPAESSLDRKAVMEFILLGLLGIIPPSVFLAWGIAHSTASNAAIISLTIPVLMVLLAFVLLGEGMTGLRWLSLGVAILGTLLVSKIEWGGGLFGGEFLTGNAVVFLGGAGSAFYNTYSKKLLARFGELEVLIYSYVVGGVACALFSLAREGRPFYQISAYPLRAWGAVFVLGAFPWGLAMALWMWVLKRLDVGQVSASVYLLSVFGVLLSTLTLHERLTLPQIAGGVLVLFGTFLTSDYEARRARPKIKT